MSTSRKVISTNVTSGPLSRSERHEISLLCVNFEKRSHGNFDSVVWNYFGELAIRSSNASSGSTSAGHNIAVVDKDRRYCSLCLQHEQGLYSSHSSGRTGHISRVKSYSKSTATSSMADHLLTVHNVSIREATGSGNGPRKQKSLEETFAMVSRNSGRENLKPATSGYQFNRDLCLMLCVDLLPFSTVSNKGFSGFCAKNLPSMQLPDESTLSRGALYDLYSSLKSDVKKQLQLVRDKGGCFCIMFDGWTDRYHARPYLGLRVSFIDPSTWKAEVKTLSVKVLESHTGEELANHVRKELDDFGIVRGTPVFSTHDGAKTMSKCSRLLEVDGFNHCVAHCIHLLLTVDSVNKISDLVDLLKKCKNVVSSLHFKGCILSDESMKIEDRQVMEILLDKIERTRDELDLDERFSDETNDVGEVSESIKSNSNVCESNPVSQPHHHHTLKQEMPTR